MARNKPSPRPSNQRTILNSTGHERLIHRREILALIGTIGAGIGLGFRGSSAQVPRSLGSSTRITTSILRSM